MIILQQLLISLFILSLSALANDKLCIVEKKVLIRGKKDQYALVNKKLKDLYCSKKFEGKYFKIVKGTSDEAISFNEDEKLTLKAANVYYHLTLARDFWINTIKSDYVKQLKQITIRLEITNSYSELRHFKNEKLEENFNNAWTIPAGNTPHFAPVQKSWDQEVWFSPIKKLATRDTIESSGKNPIHEGLVAIKEPIVDFNKNSLLFDSLGFIAYPNQYQSSYLASAITNVGVIAVVYGLVETSKHIDKWFIDKYYFIDTAMVPDIIYHEYSHIALSDTMKPVHSVPVIEGMADYFASLIANRDKMYSKIKGISNNKVRNRKSRKFYHPYLEEDWNSESDFTLSVLWKVRNSIAAENKKRTELGRNELIDPSKLIHHAHLHMNEEADIINDLPKALIDTCKEYCENVRLGTSAIYQSFEKKGFN